MSPGIFAEAALSEPPVDLHRRHGLAGPAFSHQNMVNKELHHVPGQMIWTGIVFYSSSPVSFVGASAVKRRQLPPAAFQSPVCPGSFLRQALQKSEKILL